MIAELPFDPTTYAIPFFALMIGLELWILRRGRARADVLGYERRDAVASLLMGLVSVVPVLVINLGVLAIAEWLWQWRLWDLGNGIAGCCRQFPADHRFEQDRSRRFRTIAVRDRALCQDRRGGVRTR